MNEQIPKYHQTVVPILKVLSGGNPMKRANVVTKVCDEHYSHLPEELLQKRIKSGDILLVNRIGWGISLLKQAAYVFYPERGFVQITEKGLQAVAKGVLTFDEIRDQPEWKAHQKSKERENELIEKTTDENASPQDLIESGFATIEAELKGELLDRLKNINPYYFEKVVLILFKKMGYGDFLETSKSNDGGIDGIINEDALGLEKIYIQAKRYNGNKVQETDIRNFIGAMSGDTSKGIFVTTSVFAEKAAQKAKEAHHKIVLIDGEKLTDLMHQYGVGVQIQNIYEMKEIDEDFFEEV